MPAPTSFSSGACSWTSTSRPRLSSASAAASPPMPPPMMTIFSRRGHHSIFTPVAFTTAVQRGISSAMNVA